MLEWEDVQRLIAESTHVLMGAQQGDRVSGWARGNNVDPEVISRIRASSFNMLSTVMDRVASVNDEETEAKLVQLTVESIGVMYFMLGWDAHKQYGGGDDRSKDFPS